jgi:hypothetical protein
LALAVQLPLVRLQMPLQHLGQQLQQAWQLLPCAPQALALVLLLLVVSLLRPLALHPLPLLSLLARLLLTQQKLSLMLLLLALLLGPSSPPFWLQLRHRNPQMQRLCSTRAKNRTCTNTCLSDAASHPGTGTRKMCCPASCHCSTVTVLQACMCLSLHDAHLALLVVKQWLLHQQPHQR